MTRLVYTAERDLPDIDYMQPRFMQGFFAYVFARPYAEGRRVLDAVAGRDMGRTTWPRRPGGSSAWTWT